MIVPMKKLSLVVMERDSEIFLKKLREIGVVHLTKKNGPSSLPVELTDRQAKNRWALSFLSRYQTKETTPAEDYIAPGDMAAHIQSLVDEKKVLLDQAAHFSGEKRKVEIWGDFDPYDFTFLSRHGVKLFLYRLPYLVYKRIGDEAKLIVLSQDKQWVKAAAVGEEIPGIVPWTIPGLSLSTINGRLETIHKRIGEIAAELENLVHYKDTMKNDMNSISEEIEFETARAGMGSLEDASTNIAISWLSGFVPEETIDTVIQTAKENGWTLAWDDPSSADHPPTILRNNPFIRIIQPLFSMLGTIPGYWEHDISLSYMVFLCVFFAMIFGDAGYGLVLFLFSFALGLSLKKKSRRAGGGKAGVFPDAAKLVMLFSASTMVWGTVTGSWFAIPVGNLPSFLRLLIVPPFNSTGPVAEFPVFLQNIFNLPKEVPMDDLKTTWNIQFLCFTVGMIQLVWARATNIRKLLPSLTAFAQAGWVIAMAGIYFLVLYMLLKMPLPSFSPWFIAAGILLNFIFSEQNGGNFFKNILKSLSNFFSIFLKAIGGFADIISYIRLFAVGMAGGMIAQTFNSMAIPAEGLGSFGIGFILKLIIAVLVLACGHALNLLMNTMSLIIHGVRLNLLEYAGNHLGMDWSGYAYKPFASRQKD